MPNLKICVDQSLPAARHDALLALLPGLRDRLCRDLSVPVTACQLNIVAVAGLPDQPLVNAEIMILPKPDRTRDAVLALCETLRAQLAEAAETHVAIRASALDPETYVALK